MCGIANFPHDLSTEDMVSSIVKQARESMTKATQVVRAPESCISSTSNSVKTTVAPIDCSTSKGKFSDQQDHDMDDMVDIMQIKEDRSSLQTDCKGSSQGQAKVLILIFRKFVH
jgi:hypothetical protein